MNAVEIDEHAYLRPDLAEADRTAGARLRPDRLVRRLPGGGPLPRSDARGSRRHAASRAVDGVVAGQPRAGDPDRARRPRPSTQDRRGLVGDDVSPLPGRGTRQPAATASSRAHRGHGPRARHALLWPRHRPVLRATRLARARTRTRASSPPSWWRRRRRDGAGPRRALAG